MLTFPRIVTGVEVFRAGTHTSSEGIEVVMTADQLDFMVEIFNGGIPEFVPLKLGHTSPEFTRMVAAQLGIPEAGLEGEISDDGERVDGVIALGRVVKLSRQQEDLVADLEVPEQVAFLIEDGFLRAVSAELSAPDGNGNRIMTGLALLSAERPAVKELKPLAAAAILAEQRRPALAFSEPTGTLKGARISKMGDAERRSLIKRTMSLFRDSGQQEEKANMKDFLSKIASAVGLSSSGGDLTEDVVAKAVTDQAGLIATLRQTLFGESEDGSADLAQAVKDVVEFRARKMAEDDEDDDEDEKKKKQEDMSEFSEAKFAAAIAAATKPLNDQIAKLQSDNELVKLTAECAKFTAIEGTPEQLAKQLLDLPESAREPMKKAWAQAQSFAEKTSLMRPSGTGVRPGAAPTGENPAGEAGVRFEELITNWLKKPGNENKDRYAAMAALSDSHPLEFAEYAAGVNA